jgi:catechol 2,3-dioxygenase-like lactoylglutathione lyase family enzyme
VEQVISNLMKNFDRGTLTRRELMTGLALIAAASSTASAAEFQSTSVNHISIQVSNLRRSVDWYKNMFGLTEQKSNDPTVIRLLVGNGQPYFTFSENKPVGFVDHLALGIPGLDTAAAPERVKAMGLQNNPDVGGVTLKDPDGLTLQLSRT